jgi:hypothetical protein
LPAPPWRSRKRKLAMLSRLADQRGVQSMQVSPKGVKWMGLRSRFTLIASCEKLEELEYSVEERSAELEIMQMEDGSPYDGDVMVGPAVFLNATANWIPKGLARTRPRTHPGPTPRPPPDPPPGPAGNKKNILIADSLSLRSDGRRHTLTRGAPSRKPRALAHTRHEVLAHKPTTSQYPV